MTLSARQLLFYGRYVKHFKPPSFIAAMAQWIVVVRASGNTIWIMTGIVGNNNKKYWPMWRHCSPRVKTESWTLTLLTVCYQTNSERPGQRLLFWPAPTRWSCNFSVRLLSGGAVQYIHSLPLVGRPKCVLLVDIDYVYLGCITCHGSRCSYDFIMPCVRGNILACFIPLKKLSSPCPWQPKFWN